MSYEPIINTIEFQDYRIDVLRLDLIHPLYGGNKYFKLKYNLDKARSQGSPAILTFGGAHSNHIYSTSAVCRELKTKGICVIRGEDITSESPTLQFARECGMHLHFVSRENYKRKTGADFIEELYQKFGEFYLIPEGAANYVGVKGCGEILNEDLKKYKYVFCASGTAGTFSGINISAGSGQNVIGISVLKGQNKLIEDANKWMNVFGKEKIVEGDKALLDHSTILSGYHFGGYACYDVALVKFKNDFENIYQIPLDYVYTSKLFFAVFDLIKKNSLIKNTRILIVHSGGLQGNTGFEKRYGLG